VDLDALPLAVESAGEMLPPGLDLGHQPGCFQPLLVPLARLALPSEGGAGQVLVSGMPAIEAVAVPDP